MILDFLRKIFKKEKIELYFCPLFYFVYKFDEELEPGRQLLVVDISRLEKDGEVKYWVKGGRECFEKVRKWCEDLTGEELDEECEEIRMKLNNVYLMNHNDEYWSWGMDKNVNFRKDYQEN